MQLENLGKSMDKCIKEALQKYTCNGHANPLLVKSINLSRLSKTECLPNYQSPQNKEININHQRSPKS